MCWKAAVVNKLASLPDAEIETHPVNSGKLSQAFDFFFITLKKLYRVCDLLPEIITRSIAYQHSQPGFLMETAAEPFRLAPPVHITWRESARLHEVIDKEVHTIRP
jgi:hypothetical protein